MSVTKGLVLLNAELTIGAVMSEAEEFIKGAPIPFETLLYQSLTSVALKVLFHIDTSSIKPLKKSNPSVSPIWYVFRLVVNAIIEAFIIRIPSSYIEA